MTLPGIPPYHRSTSPRTMSPPRLRKLATLPSHADRVWQSAAHPTLPLLATASGDKTAHVTSLLTYRSLGACAGAHKRSVRAVAWKPGTKGESTLATGSFDASVAVWRRYEDDLGAATGGEYADEPDDEWLCAVGLDGHESEVKGVAWSAGGTFLATCSRDKSVWVWEELDDDNFETVAVVQEHTQDVKAVAWHPEELLLASASYDDTIRLYKEDVDDWLCCALLKGHASTVWSVVFEPLAAPHYDAARSARLASCSGDRSVRVWTRVAAAAAPPPAHAAPSILRHASIDEEWVQTAVLPAAHDRAVYAVSWSPVTGRVVSCGGDGKIVVYEEVQRQPAQPEKRPADADTPMGEAEATAETTAEADDGGGWRIVAELEGAHGVFEVNHVLWCTRYKDKRRDDDEIIVSCGDDGEVSVWELDESE